MKQLIPILLIAFGLLGCASNEQIANFNQAEVDIARAQASIRRNPDMIIECEDCKGMRATYFHASNQTVINRQKVTGTNDVTLGVARVLVPATASVLGDVANAAMVVGVARTSGGGNKTTENSTTNTIIGDDNSMTSQMDMSEDTNASVSAVNTYLVETTADSYNDQSSSSEMTTTDNSKQEITEDALNP